MVQPKYSPEEALNKMKLMMSYDSSKTLNENKKSLKPINEDKKLLNEILPILAALALPNWSTSDNTTKIITLGAGCDKTDAKSVELKRQVLSNVDQTKFASQFRKAFDYSIGGYGIGGGTDLETLRKVLSDLEARGNYGDYCKIRELMGGKKFETDMIEELNTGELGEVISVIELLLSKSTAGNIKIRDAETANLNWWIESFPCLETTDSFDENMVVDSDRYGNSFVTVKFKIKGKIKKFHLLNNGRIYTEDTHKYTGKKVECNGIKVTVIAESLKKKSIYEQADLGNIDLSGNGAAELDPDNDKPKPIIQPIIQPRYRTDCKGIYIKGCKSDAIKPVQACLGLVEDGKFWDKTQAALEAKGFSNGFTDADIPKICNKQVVDRDVIDVDAEDPNGL